MNRYDSLVPALNLLLPARTLALLGRAVQFIQRLRTIQASLFVRAVVLSRFGHGNPGFSEARHWYSRLGGRQVWPRPFQKRFLSAASVALFERVFETAVRPWRTGARERARHPLARLFPDVVVWDSTLVQVSDRLARAFKGTRAAAASLKVHVAISVFGLLPIAARLVPANLHDMEVFPELTLFRKGSLLLFDKGFVAYHRLREISEAGLHYLCPMRLNGNPIVVGVHKGPAWLRRKLKKSPEGVRLRSLLPARKRIGTSWDLDVVLWPKTQAYARQAVPARLVLLPGPKLEQRPYLTSLSVTTWTPAVLGELYRLRWQVELVFKELKQHLNLESMPSKNRHAVQVFVWASLIALALSRTVASCLQPLATLVGLASKVRPILVSRALQGTVRLLARVLTAPSSQVGALLRLFMEEVLSEVRTLDIHREDSFRRLVPLLPSGP
ncbi:IS4 family transposase [Myxococcus sp. K38C18041901]|uniref:IS4 family transposase n=1 Tax=Myxococcus guangdongensis TaxID=2906760 RepID=UPI0020A82172|nr:IS4 family transposase [Myxococcus guangdongensis]MCP3065883.1 IS4 family transposase [Myxococcus guangdongensis]